MIKTNSKEDNKSDNNGVCRSSKNKITPLIAIGTSTGGPKALASILSELPAGLKAAIVIIQHVDAPFAPNFKAWLSELHL